ncbi:anthranilate synthase component I [Planctellipticum variicoloris]|uniref:anthranilate synthase component I n=1 Tax=Planctellipticum variicoloris TaxID=3064265 RepID=UPI0030136BDF|nr:anthranilate synthase component I [Planctomycetaceae bacterium SH412]
MSPRPDFAAFDRAATQGDLVPVYRQLVGDSLTPVGAYCRIRHGGDSFLFESVIGGEKVGRFSFLGAGPFLRLEARGHTMTQTSGGESRTWTAEDPLQELETLLAGYRAAHLPELPRFCGGAVGYAGYDTIRYSENLPHAPADDRQIPDLSFALYNRMVIFDHIRKTVLAVAHADLRQFGTTREAYDAAVARIDDLCQQLRAPNAELSLSDISLTGSPQLAYESNFTREGFENAVRKCQEYIRAGDIFQVVIGQRLALETEATPLDIYRALRIVNPSPFMFLLENPDVQLVGSSPEIMVRVEDGETTIRPLAGTRKRGQTEEEDRALERELLADEKERAEHVMLVDLARNDVGRVAQYGSVVVSDVMKVERYSHVMHITSNVTGQLCPGKTALDALRAGLPAGTVSGAPKVRAMEIIDELEPTRRGPYAGAVGYLDYTGNMDTCIALRTLVMQGRKAYVQAGAGIVADSDPASEFEETLNKARGLLKAIEVAQEQIHSPG